MRSSHWSRACLALVLAAACDDDAHDRSQRDDPITQTDCAGEPDGVAFLDDCRVCVGGSTGRTPCVVDCGGEPDGAAFVDECQQCVGGGTGLRACTQDCNGRWGGYAHLDACGQCVEGDSGETGCVEDCNRELGGHAFIDACGECVGGTTGRIACGKDCNEQFGGDAYRDECGECVGGSTGQIACAKDCHGDWGGLAYVDACGACVGGHSGLAPCVEDCQGEPGGTATRDMCNRCTGGSTGLEACVEDCNHSYGGSATIDECGQCTGGSTGRTPCTRDCNDQPGGSAHVDDCGSCVGGNTGRTACTKDCHGDFGGSARLDACGVCSGGNSGHVACQQDCNGQWGGLAELDGCGRCAGGTTGITPCRRDCHDDWGGSAFVDGCGQCVGGSTGRTACPIDCHGDAGGTAQLDACQRCVGGNTGLSACTQDCNGSWGGSAFVDRCQQCVGGTTARSACTQDCNGDWGGSAVRDRCGVCSGGDSGREPCQQDCNGDWGGSAELDRCNVCVGGRTGRTACTEDCNGDWGGQAALDRCDMCAGGLTGRTTCVADCSGDWGGSARTDECGRCVEGNTGLVACVPGECKVGPGEAYSFILSALSDARCEVILLGARTYAEAIYINRPVVIRGAGAGATVLKTRNFDPPVTVAWNGVARLEGLSITGGGGSIYKEAVHVDNAELELVDVDVHDNADGGIDAYHATLRLVRTTVRNNGRGIVANGGETLLEESRVAGNYRSARHESTRGAGIASGGKLVLRNTVVEGNTISGGVGEGAGIAGSGDIEIVGSRLRDNAITGTDGSGVAIALFGEVKLLVRGSEITGNRIETSRGGRSSTGGIVGITAVGDGAHSVLFDHVTIEENEIFQQDSVYTSLGAMIGIHASGVPLTADFHRVTVRNNRVSDPQRAVQGGVWGFETYDAQLSASIRECLVQDNTFAAGYLDGGVLYADARIFPKAPHSRIDVTFDRSLVTGNSMQFNRATSSGAGLVMTEDGWSFPDNAHVLVQNSTLHANSITGTAVTVARGNIVFVNSTVTDNASRGASTLTQQLAGNISAYHSVFSGNPAGTAPCVPVQTGDSRPILRIAGQYNWFNDPNSCVASDDEHTTFGVNPGLGPLADHGGYTPSRAPADDSPLIDGGDATCAVGGEAGPMVDQRGGLRPLGAACDLGSVELR
jgi:hypothetical protein